MAGAPVRQQPSSAARRSETAFERHARLVAAAVSYYGERPPEAPTLIAAKTDQDVLRETFRWVLAVIRSAEYLSIHTLIALPGD